MTGRERRTQPWSWEEFIWPEMSFRNDLLLAEDFDIVIQNEMIGLCLNKASFMVWNGRDCFFEWKY